MADATTQASAEPLVPGTEAYTAAMIAKFDAHQGRLSGPQTETPAAPAVPQRPAHVPEKFWDATTGTVKTDEVLKSYAELERAKSKTPAAPAAAPVVDPAVAKATTDAAAAKTAHDAAVAKAAANPNDTEAATAVATAKAALDAAEAAKTTAESTAAKAVVTNAGLNFDEFSNEFSEKGALSDESYAKLEKAGLSRDVVDAYVEGQKAIAERTMSEVKAITGGDEGYTAMTQWAKSNLSAEEIELFNKQVAGTKSEVTAAVSGLFSRYTLANGQQPKLQHGNSGVVNTGYESREAMKKDMRDPRYNTDPAFRSQVIKRVDLTTAF